MLTLESFIGKRRMLELLVEISDNEPIYLAQLTKRNWNAVTGIRLLRELEIAGLISRTVEGGEMGESLKKVYRMTPKGTKVLEHLREIQKLLDGRLGNK